MENKKSKSSCFVGALWVILLPILLYTGIWFIGWFNSPLKKLPNSATNAVSEYIAAGISDGAYFLKAKIDKEGFIEFVDTMQLDQEYVDTNHNFWRVAYYPGPEWWDPPRIPEMGAYTEGERDYTVAAYRDGWLYYVSVGW